VNEIDPLYPLSDTAGHLTCLSNDPLGRSMLAASEKFLASTGPGKRTCVVCGEEVRDPENYFLIGYLADPACDPFSKFNCTHLHKSHILKWKQADEFLSLARAALIEGKWRGSALTEIIQEIETGKSVSGSRHQP